MKEISNKRKRIPTAESIARKAERGEDVSHFFTNAGRMHQPVQRVSVDFTSSMSDELDQAAGEMNVSRQAIIKSFVRQGLDQHYMAQRARKP
jgi:hypothetical protein